MRITNKCPTPRSKRPRPASAFFSCPGPEIYLETNVGRHERTTHPQEDVPHGGFDPDLPSTVARFIGVVKSGQLQLPGPTETANTTRSTDHKNKRTREQEWPRAQDTPDLAKLHENLRLNLSSIQPSPEKNNNRRRDTSGTTLARERKKSHQ